MSDTERDRIHSITYSCDSRVELAERIAALEALCEDAVRLLGHFCADYAMPCDACPAGPNDARACELVTLEDRATDMGLAVHGGATPDVEAGGRG